MLVSLKEMGIEVDNRDPKTPVPYFVKFDAITAIFPVLSLDGAVNENRSYLRIDGEFLRVIGSTIEIHNRLFEFEQCLKVMKS